MQHNTILAGMFWMIKAAFETWEVPQDCLTSDNMVMWTKMLELVLFTAKETILKSAPLFSNSRVK